MNRDISKAERDCSAFVGLGFIINFTFVCLRRLTF
jgi:hypothetical protein